MKIFEVLKERKYLALAVISSAVMSLMYVYIQVLGIVENVLFWFQVVPLYNILFFFAFSVLFGVTLSYQIYLRSQPKTCSINKSIGTSSSATFGIFLISQCPACASLGAFILPISAVGLLAKYNWAVNLFSIGMLMFTLNYLGAFKREVI